MFSFLNPYMLYLKIGGAVLACAAVFGSGMWLEGTVKDRAILKMQRDAAQAEVAAANDAAAHQAAADKITHDRDVANAAEHQKIVTVQPSPKRCPSMSPRNRCSLSFALRFCPPARRLCRHRCRSRSRSLPRRLR
jgi:hypothetical protein